MRKSQKEFSNNINHFITQIEKEKKGKLILKNFNHKDSSSFIPTKLKKDENKVFTEYNNNNNLNLTNSHHRKSYILNVSNSPQKNKKKNIEKYKRLSSFVPNSNNSSMNQNLLSGDFNLINFFKKNIENNSEFLPNISNNDKNTQIESSFKINNNSKESLLKKKFYNKNIRNESPYHNTKPKLKFSTQNIKINQNNISPYKPARRFMKMKTVFNLNKQIDLLTSEIKLKEKNMEEKEEKKEENKKKSKKGFQNQKLLYSKKFNNYIFKIYKAVDPKKDNKTKKKNYNLKNRNNNKSPNFCIKDYLNNFNSKIYIQNIKNKIKKGNIGNSKKVKNKLLDKCYDYIEYNVYKNIKNYKKKQDIFEKIKEKNIHLIAKEKKELINMIINEILFKLNFKHKNIFFRMNFETLLISQLIKFQIHIKLAIIRHVLTKSEKHENLYFINLVKHLLYSGDQNNNNNIKYQFIKSIEDIVSPYMKRTTTVEKFIEFNKKDIYYSYFCIKFQLLDCETILKSYEEKKIKLYSTKYIKPTNLNTIKKDKSDPESEKEKDNFSSIEERIKKMTRRSKRSRKNTFINRIKLTSSSKIVNLNLTKNIINLRNVNINEALKSKTPLNLKNINNLITKKSKNINEYDDSSDSFEYEKYRKKYTNKNLVLNSNSSIRENNYEIHQRDRILLYEHFVYFVEFSEYDKLIYWLKKSSKYIDLNYKFENGDTLLHLCVRHSVPHYIYKFLITHGVNVNAQNNQGDTVLHLAAKNHKYKTIDFLIKMGASEYIYNKMRKMCWECL